MGEDDGQEVLEEETMKMRLEPDDIDYYWTRFFDELKWHSGRDYRQEVIDAYDLHDGIDVHDFTLLIEYWDLDHYDHNFAEWVMYNIETATHHGINAAKKCVPLSSLERYKDVVRFRLRLFHLPKLFNKSIKSITPDDCGKLFQFKGVVQSAEDVLGMATVTYWECAKCHVVFKEQHDGNGPEMSAPFECPKDEGGCGRSIKNTRFIEHPEVSRNVASQDVR